MTDDDLPAEDRATRNVVAIVDAPPLRFAPTRFRPKDDMDPRKAVELALDKALVAQQPLARKNVARLRRVHPDDSPKQVLRRIDRAFLTAVTSTGGAAGAAALVPGAGIPSAIADMMAFTEASAFYVLNVAEVHGLHPDDHERRKTLVMAVLIGDSAVAALDKAIPRVGGHWAKHIVDGIPMAAINRVNKVLGPRFVTKYGSKQGVLVLGKQVPMGIGAVLGGGGNHVFGRLTARTARKIFGPPPATWTDKVVSASGADLV